MDGVADQMFNPPHELGFGFSINSRRATGRVQPNEGRVILLDRDVVFVKRDKNDSFQRSTGICVVG